MLVGYEAKYRDRLSNLTKCWARYRKSKGTEHLQAYHKVCCEIAHEIETFPLLALQQIFKSMCEAAAMQLSCEQNIKAFIKEVDWLMNQLIRAQHDGSDIFMQKRSKGNDNNSLIVEVNAELPQLTHANKPNIAIIDDQVSVAQLLRNNLQDFALNVTCFSSIQTFKNAPEFATTDLVLLDIVMPDTTEIEVFEFANELVDKDIKVISCSSKFTFETRLLAVRAKVTDYAVKPINTYVLVEKIGRALRLQNRRDHRIVIVDDQETMGVFYKTMLEQLGCEVTFFQSAHALFDSLDDLNPDMFLLDMMMPDVDGLEVAKMIRQEHKFDFAPILFLTADELVENRLAAIATGADDVINKTSSVNTITTQVITRVKRASDVRAFVAKDPLTGVLNHGQIVESANQTMRLSKRRKTLSALAVIDVDLFKNVNDTHGHIVGDKVLCALGQLMANSVRETDSVGRYGGEEFVIVFEDCNLEDASTKVQMIKDTFNNIDFRGNQQNFKVSFSAGVVALGDYDNVQSAIGFADKALYRAKEEGRNKVVMYRKK